MNYHTKANAIGWNILKKKVLSPMFATWTENIRIHEIKIVAMEENIPNIKKININEIKY